MSTVPVGRVIKIVIPRISIGTCRRLNRRYLHGKCEAENKKYSQKDNKKGNDAILIEEGSHKIYIKYKGGYSPQDIVPQRIS